MFQGLGRSIIWGLGALSRIKDALKAAVGKEGIEEVVTEGPVARLGRSRKQQE